MAALLRSVATKMARAPPRLPSVRERHGPSSRFSTSTGSTPPPANLRGPQNHNKEVPSDHWNTAIVAFNEAATIAAFFLLGGFAFMHFKVNPRLDRIQANMDTQCEALVTMREDIEKSHERTLAIINSIKERQIEATDVFEGKRTTRIGTK